MEELAWEHDFDLNAGAFGAGNEAVCREKANAEAVMHELGHQLALRPERKSFVSLFDVSKAIDRLSLVGRDANEILACAIEVACARLLGLTMSTRLIEVSGEAWHRVEGDLEDLRDAAREILCRTTEEFIVDA